jgi:hypothetical protein
MNDRVIGLVDEVVGICEAVLTQGEDLLQPEQKRAVTLAYYSAVRLQTIFHNGEEKPIYELRALFLSIYGGAKMAMSGGVDADLQSALNHVQTLVNQMRAAAGDK